MHKNTQKIDLCEYALLVLFAVLLLIPLLFGLFGWFNTPAHIIKIQEQRTKVELPNLPRSVEKIKQFPKAIEHCFNDNFGLRSYLIRANALLKRKMGVSSNPDKVVLGKDGWLFLGNKWANTMNQCLGRDSFSQKELEYFVKVLEARKDWLKARNIPMIFAIAPDKNTIYPEYLPDWAQKGTSPTRREQLFARLSKTDLLFVDTTDAVMKAKTNALTFYKTDSHWNNYGAWVGYKVIMDFIQKRIGHEGFRVIEENDFEIEQSKKDGFALPQMLGLDGRDAPDIEIQLKLSDALDQRVEVRDIRGQHLDQSTADKNPKIRKSSIRSVTCQSLNPDGIKVLILRDSFTTNMSPYFNLSFGETTYCAWGQGPGKEMTRLVEHYNVDLVILIMVERTLKLPQKVHPNWQIPDGKTIKERWHNEPIVSEGNGISLLDKVINQSITKRGMNPGSLDVTLSKGRRLKVKPLLNSGHAKSLSCLRFQVVSTNQTAIKIKFRVAGNGGSQKRGYRVAQLYEGSNDIFFILPLNALRQPIEVSTTKKSLCSFERWQIFKPSKPIARNHKGEQSV